MKKTVTRLTKAARSTRTKSIRPALRSIRTGTLILMLVAVALPMLGSTAIAVEAGSTTYISVNTSGGASNNDSDRSAPSANGRYIAFDSYSSNLISGDTNGRQDIFLRDRTSGSTQRLSISTGGTPSNGFYACCPTTSFDGRYTVFETDADNLVAGDANFEADIFIRDKTLATTTRLSVSSGGVEANSYSAWPVITPDGRYVSFESSATNLVSGDTGQLDIFRRDRTTNTTIRISVTDLEAQSNGTSLYPASSGDGRYVAFSSRATNLIGTDANGTLDDVFLRDVTSGTTARISSTSAGAAGNSSSLYPSISGDGRYVAYESQASNLVSGDTNAKTDIFVRDRTAGTTTRASVDSSGAQANGQSMGPQISENGRYLVFSSTASNLVAGDTNGYDDLFVRDLVLGTTSLVSLDSAGNSAGGPMSWPWISDDGRHVTFDSSNELVAADTNFNKDIYHRDRGPMAPLISSSTHPSSATWYANDDPAFSWSASDATSGIGGYSYVLDQTAATTPDTISEGAAATKTYANVADGAWWFHVRTVDAGGIWGSASHYKVQIDATGPAMSSLTSSTHPSQTTWYTSDDPSFNWSSSDVSGVTGYSYSLDGISNTTPDTTSEGAGTTKSYVDVADGVSWFHVMAQNGAGAWGAPSHYKVQIDDTGAGAPTVSSSTHPSQTSWYANDDPAISWTASDVSGITGYSYDLNQTEGTIPNETSEGTGTSTTGSNLADGIWWFHIRAQNGVGIWGATAHFKLQIDDAAPTTPSVSSSTHPSPTTWYQSNDPSFSWSASATSGIAGYSYELNQIEVSTPPMSSQGAGTTATFTDKATGAWWFHVRALSGSGVWGAPSHYKVQIDTDLPTAPVVLGSSHLPNVASADRTVDVQWSAGADLHSGVSGYSWTFNNSATTPADTTQDGGSSVLTATSSPLASGNWYFHVRTIDNVGNASTDVVYGPIVIDTLGPLLSKTVSPTETLYASGQLVTYTVTVTNQEPSSMTMDSLTDTLPSSLAVAKSSVKIDGQSCNADTTPACVFSGLVLSISGLTVPPDSSKTITYSAVVVGSGRECETVVNNLSGTARSRTATASLPITICDSGLGLENWWSFVQEPIGPGGSASVNAGNGNLVVQQTDSSPVGAHGRLGYVLRRTYNSQDTGVLSLPGSLGAGWTLNVSESGDLEGEGISASGLYVPPAESFLNPVALTMIDRDGTRHAFTPRGLGAAIDVSPDIQPLGVQDALRPKVLAAEGFKICVDQTYSAPAGVHLGLWRYVRVNGTCAAPGTDKEVLGFASMRPDRIRSEFAATGQLISMTDGSGVELEYRYENAAAPGVNLGKLTTIFEPRSCSDPATATCRAFRFAYPTTTRTEITDPAGRVTKYHFDSATTFRLTRVENPDGTEVNYTYGAACGGSANQLCSATDPKGNATAFTYSASSLGLPRVASIRDRRSTDTTFTYSSSPDRVEVDRSGQRRRFSNIDSSGRVGLIEEGDTNNSFLRQTTLTWDVTGTTCRQPDNTVDNNLCRRVRESFNAATPDEDTTFVFNAEGGLLKESKANTGGAIDSTFGYRATYVQSGGSATTFDDSVAGSGTVTSAGGTRTQPSTLFFLSDRTQSLTPRGNAAGAGYAPYLTTFKVDNNSTAAPSTEPSGAACTNPDAPTTNTGDLCESVGPSFNNSVSPTVTRYTYDTFGQRISMTTPKSIAETTSGTPPAYTYTYYSDGALDLSGSVSAGGWLKAVTDPAGKFVAFAYDRGGNVVRTWDRNATAGHTISEFPGTIAAPTNSRYAETLFATGAETYSAPGRYVRSQRDPIGNLTTLTLDSNGNQTVIRSPRGNEAGNSTFDTVQAFDQNDNITSRRLPEEAAADKPSRFTYDVHDNPRSSTSPNGDVTTNHYDFVNRMVETRWTRGPWNASEAPASCRQSVGSDSPIPTGRILCSSLQTYDGVDNVLSKTDGAAKTATFVYDAVHRETRRDTPREDGAFTSTRTDTLYDRDGNVTDICPPRQFVEGGACNSTAPFSIHNSFDVAGRKVSTTTYRTSGGAANTSSFGYDADGNVVTTTDPNAHTTTFSFDLLDRRASALVPRDATTSHTTTWTYDPSGSMTSVTKPGSRITAYSYDHNNRLVDTVVGSSSTDAAAAGLATGTQNTRTRVSYDADGNVVTRHSPRAFASSVTNPDDSFKLRIDYDKNGRAVAQWVPRYGSPASDLGLSSTQTAQCPGATGFPSGVGVCVTRLSYDLDGNPSTLRLPTSNGSDNRYLTFSYTDDNLVSSEGAPSPSTPGARVIAATHLYDGAGRRTKTTDALGRATNSFYFADGLLAQVTAPANGSVTHATSYGYDASGNKTAETDALNQTASTTYFADNLAKDSIDTGGNKTSYVYDPAGNISQVKSPAANALADPNPSGTPTLNTFTHDNLLSTATVPLKGDGSERRRTSYSYDAAGRKTSQEVEKVNASGSIVLEEGGIQSFTYHPNDRMGNETGRGSETINYGYDPSGNRTQITDSTSGGSTITSTYYLDELARTVDDGSRTTNYTYNGAGSIAGRSFKVNGSSTSHDATYSYSDASLPVSMTSTDSGNASYSYDAVGRPATQTLPSGQSLTYTFNSDDTLAEQKLASGAITQARWTYTYDGLYRQLTQGFEGQAAGLPTPAPVSGNFSYGYDTAGRINSFTDHTGANKPLTWDPDGNRRSFGPQDFTYRADGSIATAEDPSGANPKTYDYEAFGGTKSDGCNDYLYDGFDRMREAEGITGLGCPTPTASPSTYAHDGLDRQRSAPDSMGNLLGNKTIHYDGLSQSVSIETAPSTGADMTYTLDAGGSPVAATKTSPTTTHLLVDDGQGNISTAATSSGGIACTVRHDPFGTPVGALAESSCSSGDTHNDIFFNGGRKDAATGTYQFGSRIYDPAKATFLTPDSYRNGDPSLDLSVGTDPLTRNTYSYVNGDPVNLFDPDGHFGCKKLGWFKNACRRAVDKIKSQTRKGTVIGDIATTTSGVIQGAAEVGMGTALMLANPVAAGQAIAAQAVGAYKEAGGGASGALAALNQVNPAFHMLTAGDAWLTAAKQGNLKEAGRQGFHAAFNLSLTVGAAAGGVEAASSRLASRSVTTAERTSQSAASNGEFSIVDWKGYPEGLARPAGPFRLLEGEEYIAARQSANHSNRSLHRSDPSLEGLHIHELHPVKFGGSPTNLANKVALKPIEHAPYTVWWNRFLRDLSGR